MENRESDQVPVITQALSGKTVAVQRSEDNIQCKPCDHPSSLAFKDILVERLSNGTVGQAENTDQGRQTQRLW